MKRFQDNSNSTGILYTDYDIPHLYTLDATQTDSFLQGILRTDNNLHHQDTNTLLDMQYRIHYFYIYPDQM
jgi:hypothetical protein